MQVDRSGSRRRGQKLMDQNFAQCLMMPTKPSLFYPLATPWPLFSVFLAPHFKCLEDNMSMHCWIELYAHGPLSKFDSFCWPCFIDFDPMTQCLFWFNN